VQTLNILQLCAKDIDDSRKPQRLKSVCRKPGTFHNVGYRTRTIAMRSVRNVKFSGNACEFCDIFSERFQEK